MLKPRARRKTGRLDAYVAQPLIGLNGQRAAGLNHCRSEHAVGGKGFDIADQTPAAQSTGQYLGQTLGVIRVNDIAAETLVRTVGDTPGIEALHAENNPGLSAQIQQAVAAQPERWG